MLIWMSFTSQKLVIKVTDDSRRNIVLKAHTHCWILDFSNKHLLLIGKQYNIQQLSSLTAFVME